MMISKELLDELLSRIKRSEDSLGDKSLMKELKVRLMERMLRAELTEHLGFETHGEPYSQQTNRRDGATRKVLKGKDGVVPIDMPRDCDGSFEPELIQKGQTRIERMDDKIIGLHAAGLSTRNFCAHLEGVYGLKGLCCTKRVRDSCHESSVVAGLHEQTDITDLQNHELGCLQWGAKAPWVTDDL